MDHHTARTAWPPGRAPGQVFLKEIFPMSRRVDLDPNTSQFPSSWKCCQYIFFAERGSLLTWIQAADK